MENLKKAIPLNQASKLSGYHSDYLSSLIRKGELKGTKIGGNWFTTEEAIKDYVFKQKVRHKELAVADFLSPARTRKIFILAGITFLSVVLLGIYLYGKNTKIILEEGKTTLSTEAEIIN
jgi:hypothetical protein